MILDLQHKLKEERDQIEKMLENNIDKRSLYDMEKKYSIQQEKNKALYIEVVNLRK